MKNDKNYYKSTIQNFDAVIFNQSIFYIIQNMAMILKTSFKFWCISGYSPFTFQPSHLSEIIKIV